MGSSNKRFHFDMKKKKRVFLSEIFGCPYNCNEEGMPLIVENNISQITHYDIEQIIITNIYLII